jgi:hypothetical protein
MVVYLNTPLFELWPIGLTTRTISVDEETQSTFACLCVTYNLEWMNYIREESDWIDRIRARWKEAQELRIESVAWTSEQTPEHGCHIVVPEIAWTPECGAFQWTVVRFSNWDYHAVLGSRNQFCCFFLPSEQCVPIKYTVQKHTRLVHSTWLLCYEGTGQ